MVPTLFFYQLGLVALGCVFLMLCWLWPNNAASPRQPIVPTTPSRRQRSTEPKPFAGLTQRPPCALCEREATQASRATSGATRADAPDAPPAAHRGDLAALLPPWELSLSGLVGAGELARQRPSQWWPVAPIPLHCLRQLLSGDPTARFSMANRPAVELIVRVLACLTEGIGHPCHGSRLRSRPQYRVAAGGGSGGTAAGLFPGSFLCDLHLEQLQLDELYAVLRDLQRRCDQ